jgi:hypothetical protein
VEVTIEWVNKKATKEEGEEGNVADFIEMQKLAVNQAKSDAMNAFDIYVAGDPVFSNLPNVLDILEEMAKSIEERADLAAGLQIVHSAGAWAHTLKGGFLEGSWRNDSGAWVNSNYEGSPPMGVIEIEGKVKKAPIRDSTDIKITRSNWHGMSRKTEKLVKKQSGGAKIFELGASLRIILDTPVGETRFGVSPWAQGDPLIPSITNYTSVLIWLEEEHPPQTVSNVENDLTRVRSSAAVLGYYVLYKPVTELDF